MQNSHLSPKQIVHELDKYIVGQKNAKKSVSIALRNRFRRSMLEESMRDEIVPKNILMIGPTGVGKTEIARRLAKIVNAPFVKVEATKFTEVGYVGRDVESMVRDLLETAIRMVKSEKSEKLVNKAIKNANERIVQILVPQVSSSKPYRNPLEMIMQAQQTQESKEVEIDANIALKREQISEKLERGELEKDIIEIQIEDHSPSILDFMSGQGNEQMGINLQEMFGNLLPKKTRKRKLSISEARKILTQEESQKLIDMDEVIQESIYRTEQFGIIFIDEIDKIANQNRGNSGPDISREGVQRDILPIVEGSTILTKYGPVKTDYILFIAAGAFHISKPSDLIPELQGRFPIRVELSNLTLEDFVSILKEPKNALTRQYEALLKTEGITIEFSDEAIYEIAKIAVQVNQDTENIGARRLHTLLEKLLEDLSYEASDLQLEYFKINPEYVVNKLSTIVENRDLSRYIL